MQTYIVSKGRKEPERKGITLADLASSSDPKGLYKASRKLAKDQRRAAKKTQKRKTRQRRAEYREMSGNKPVKFTPAHEQDYEREYGRYQHQVGHTRYT